MRDKEDTSMIPMMPTMPMLTGGVLIVDDDLDTVQLVGMALEEEGYRVRAAAGAGALRLAREERPDVILLDLMIPGMDGAEVSRRLRADPRTARAPIVLLSAHNDALAVAATLPVDDVLSKPFTIVELAATVARWMPLSSSSCREEVWRTA